MSAVEEAAKVLSQHGYTAVRWGEIKALRAAVAAVALAKHDDILAVLRGKSECYQAWKKYLEKPGRVGNMPIQTQQEDGQWQG